MSNRLLQAAELRLVVGVIGTHVTLPVTLGVRRWTILEEMASDTAPLTEVDLSPCSDPYFAPLFHHRLAIVEWPNGLPSQILFATMRRKDQPVQVFF
jgi:hypothetical protein